jgi:hypothetical protein
MAKSTEEKNKTAPFGKAEISDYNNNRMLNLPTGDTKFKPLFTFGVKKAKLILAHIKDIEAFVKKYGKEE